MNWIKNSSGNRDAMLTLTVITFAVVLLKVIFGGTTINIGEWAISIDPISPELAGALLGPNIAGYVFRRHTDKKYPEEETAAVEEEPKDA